MQQPVMTKNQHPEHIKYLQPKFRGEIPITGKVFSKKEIEWIKKFRPWATALNDRKIVPGNPEQRKFVAVIQNVTLRLRRARSYGINT